MKLWGHQPPSTHPDGCPRPMIPPPSSVLPPAVSSLGSRSNPHRTGSHWLTPCSGLPWLPRLHLEEHVQTPYLNLKAPPQDPTWTI